MDNNKQGEFAPKTIVDVLYAKAASSPDRIAFRFLSDGEFEDSAISYAELLSRASVIAARLRQHSSPGDRALLLLPSGLSFIESFWACQIAGLVAVPAYPPRNNHNLERLNALVSDCEPSIILCDEALASRELRDLLPTLQGSINWLTYEDLKQREFDDNAADSISYTTETADVEITPGHLSFLQYTSGSTGNPKGVMISHGNVMANLEMMRQAYHLDSDSNSVNWLPLFHDMGLIGAMLLPVYLGSTAVLMPPAAFLQKPVRWLNALTKYRGKATAAPNFAFELLVKSVTAAQLDDLDLSSLNLIVCGSEPIRAETVSEFLGKFSACGLDPAAFYPGFGMAETTVFATGGDWDALTIIKNVDADSLSRNAIKLTEEGRTQQIVATGYTWLDAQLIVCDSYTRERLADGQVGEIWVSGSHVAKGYWNKPELTADAFANYLAGSGEGPYFRTGDLGCIIDGQLYIAGRAKDLIIIRGKNHYPQDIEYTVFSCSEHFQEDGCAAFPISTDQGEALVVVQEVKRSARRAIDTEAVTQRIRESIAKNHELTVHAVVLLNPNRLFKTSSGKIQRSACKQAYVDNQFQGVLHQWSATSNSSMAGEQHYELPSNASKDLDTCRLWLSSWIANRAQIAIDQVDLLDAVTSYGLDSMDSFKLLGELSDWLEIDIDPDIIWGVANADELAQQALALLENPQAETDGNVEVCGAL